MEDWAFEALADDHRRRVLLALAANGTDGDPLTVPDDVANGHESAEELYLSLYHTHLPKLVDLELVDWDVEQRTVERGPQFGNVQPLLEFLNGDHAVP